MSALDIQEATGLDFFQASQHAEQEARDSDVETDYEMNKTFQQLNNALTNCTTYFLRKAKDDEGETIYLLIDGFGDQDGDPFYDLIDVRDYITNNEEVSDYLDRHQY